MMKLTFALLALAVAIASQAEAKPIDEDELNAQFSKFKNDFGRVYPTQAEELYRKKVFATNLERFQRHNEEAAQGLHSYTMGVNQFTDWTPEEFGKRYLSNKFELGHKRNYLKVDKRKELPKSVDWIKKNAVTSVKDQASCGSCYAFSAVGALEGANAINTKKLVELSEQQIVDCSKQDGNDGCNGGWMNVSYEYIRRVGGIETEQSYPYTGIDLVGHCNFDKKKVEAQVVGWFDLKENSEEDLQYTLANYGPVAIALAVTNDWAFYGGGIIDNSMCGTDLNHAITLVGYDTDSNGTEYYTVKNSWASIWGEKGYFRLLRNKGNQCQVGIASTIPFV